MGEADLIGILIGQNGMIMKSLYLMMSGKKDIIVHINYQSMHIIVGLKIGVQVDKSIPRMGLANRLFHTLIY